MKYDPLSKAVAPFVHSLIANPSDACNELWGIPAVDVHIIRGGKSKTVSSFFDEAAAALQFPFYFGENWDAFNDCLQDLSWLKADGYVIAISDAVELLDKASPTQVKTFVSVMNEAVEFWSHAKKPKPFHIIFHSRPEDEPAMTKTWEAAGLKLHRLR
jgi:predicted GTPase